MSGRTGEPWLAQRWYSGRPAPWWLRPLSGLFAVLSNLRRWFTRPGKVDVPVVVVGNITVGGTGKTPLILWLVEAARRQGLRPGVVSRGYGGSHHGPPLRVTGESDPALVGDEPVLIARQSGAPVCVGIDRLAAARALAASGEADIILSDDGLQHYRLGRDAEIVMLDAARGFGNGWRLPAGPLREPVSRLATVDIVIANGGAAKAWPAAVPVTLEARSLCRVDGTGSAISLAEFRGRDVHAVAGIGHPERFFAQLEAIGLRIQRHAFPDHAGYSAAELDFGDDLPLVMTAKDAVKCTAFARPGWWFAQAELMMSRAAATALENVLRRAVERKQESSR